MSNFKEITPNEITKNPFEMIGKDWLLLTAGNEQSLNTSIIAYYALEML